MLIFSLWNHPNLALSEGLTKGSLALLFMEKPPETPVVSQVLFGSYTGTSKKNSVFSILNVHISIV